MLGKLSDKHARRRSMDIMTACNFWLGSNAIRCLLGLSALCFSKLNNTETEVCISDLLTIFGNHSPYFDWVVARLGSCFPLKVISKILQCGLKSFTVNLNSSLESEVGILGYLSHSHDKDLKFALNEMMSVVLTKEFTAETNFNTIPYLLHLADMSEILSQSIIRVFLDLYSKDFIEKIKLQVAFWPQNYNPANLLPIFTKLLLKTRENGTNILLILAKIAPEYLWCQELLELILTEMEMLVFDDRSCALFSDIAKDDSRKLLWSACKSSTTLEQQTALRLILYVSSSKNPLIYHQTIAELISSPQSNPNIINSLTRLLGGPYGISDNPDIKPGINMALENLTLVSRNREKLNQNYFILKNLLDLVSLEKTPNSSQYLKKCHVSQALTESLTKIIAIWEELLDKVEDEIDGASVADEFEVREAILKKIKLESENDGMEIEEPDVEVNYKAKDQIHTIARLLEILELKTNVINMCDALKMVRLTVKYFFWCLVEKDSFLRIQSLNRCLTLLNQQCAGKKGVRSAALRDLLEGGLFLYGNLFGAPTTDESDHLPIQHRKDDLLMKLNQRQGVSSIVSRSSVLHSGVSIGVPKISMQWSDGPGKDIKNQYLTALVACCQDQDMASTIDGFSNISLLLIEMISTDVMYNGLVWPDDDLARVVTMERDLHIRRTFRNSPILWSILSVVAAHRPALCYCSVFLRAICASILHQWRAKSTENVIGNNVELMFFTSKLLEIMALGDLLPGPLSYLHIVIKSLEPNEIAYVLKECVWNFMMANVPSPSLFTCDNNGLYYRDPASSKPSAQFVDPLRNCLQKKLSTMGNLYYQMFVLPELNGEN
jgi:integrator complex subunit 5